MKRMIALFMVTMLFTSMTVSAKESVTTQAVVSNYESSEESESSYDSSSASVAAPAAVTATAGVSVQAAAPGAAVKTDSVRVAIVNISGRYICRWHCMQGRICTGSDMNFFLFHLSA